MTEIRKSCNHCIKAKAACDHERPCKRCKLHNLGETCANVMRKRDKRSFRNWDFVNNHNQDNINNNLANNTTNNTTNNIFSAELTFPPPRKYTKRNKTNTNKNKNNKNENNTSNNTNTTTPVNNIPTENINDFNNFTTTTNLGNIATSNIIAETITNLITNTNTSTLDIDAGI